MTAHPLLFRAEMVRALLDGRKSQTRRPAWRELKPVPQSAFHPRVERRPRRIERRADQFWTQAPTAAQRILAGDLIWVRETSAQVHPLAVPNGQYSQPGQAGIPGPPGVTYRVIYRADGGTPHPIWHGPQEPPYRTTITPADAQTVEIYGPQGVEPVYWTPSIHMPRWASRLTLAVTAVKIERLQDISEADARAEGVDDTPADGQSYISPFGGRSIINNYAHLWNSMHGEAAWDANPEVVAISFVVHQTNVDAFLKAQAA